MGLSITNTNHISQQEIDAIAQCDLNSHLIVLKSDEQGKRTLTTLAKSEVNCWQLFLRWFGKGNLANIQVHLADITSHLNQFKWADGASLNNNSVHHQAYLKTCMLANKALLSKWDEALFNNVSTATCVKQVEFFQYQDGQRINRLDVPFEIKLNPCMQIKHAKVLLNKRFKDSAIAITENNLQIDQNTHASNKLNGCRVEVVQHLKSKFVPVPVPVPVPTSKSSPHTRARHTTYQQV